MLYFWKNLFTFVKISLEKWKYIDFQLNRISITEDFQSNLHFHEK